MKMKQLKLQAKQAGFTLLELLVVVTLIAVLATGALVAFDGADEKAQASTAAKTSGTLDQAVRAYKAVTGKFPNQWDNLSDPVTAGPAVSGSFIPAKLQDLLGSVNLASVDTALTTLDLVSYIETNLGMDEIQHIFGSGIGANGNVEPNRAHNEGTNPKDVNGNGAVETDFGTFAATGDLATGVPANLSILAAGNAGTTGNACSVGSVSISSAWTTNIAANKRPSRLNAINDALSTERCNLVVAIGFGGDAAHSTLNSPAGVSQSPSYSSKNVNPSTTYSRYVGLFLLAKGPKEGDDANDLASDGTAYGTAVDAARAGNLIAQDFLPKPILLGFLDAEGNTIDANVATASRLNN